MQHTPIIRALAITLLLAAAAPLLSACNTVAGAGQDVSATGNAVSTGAQSVKHNL